MKQRMTIYPDWDKVPVVMDLPLVCSLLGIGYETAKKMAQNGTLKAVKIGGVWRVNKSAVMQMMGV